MGARRRAGPAVIAAALLGLGLALYRPESVPVLRAGPRAAPPRPASGPAGAPAPAAGGGPGFPAAGSGRVGEEPDEAGEIAVWRDALADRPFMTGAGSGEYPAYISGAAARVERPRRAVPSAAAASVRGAAEGRVPLPAERGAKAGASRAGAQPRPAGPSREAPPRRTPLALGPAPVEDSRDDEEAPAVAARPGEPRSGRASWGRRRARLFPLFHPPRRERLRPRAAAVRRRARPLLLSKLLGRGAVRPPSASIRPPDLSRLRGRRPLLLPDGMPVPVRPYDLERIEAQDPRRAGAACRRRARHWDQGLLWHDGPARGVIDDARWLWLWKEEARWWALRAPEDAPMLRHHGLWWSKQRGVWFALHDGELWSWRRFADWDAEGLIRLADGVELVYSADFTKVAVITPGAGAALYDAYTGAELGEWREDELPRRRPRAPARLRLPRGI